MQECQTEVSSMWKAFHAVNPDNSFDDWLEDLEDHLLAEFGECNNEEQYLIPLGEVKSLMFQ